MMKCPHCCSENTCKISSTTKLGYSRFDCKSCKKRFNERSGTPFNFLELPTDIVFQAVFYRLRYKLSYREIAEMFSLRGFSFSHEAVREWEERFLDEFADRLLARRKNHDSAKVVYVDETYVKVKGRWCYLYRGMDEYGDLVDVYLSDKRDMVSTKAFFEKVRSFCKKPPKEVITDGLTSYPRAVSEVLGEQVRHTKVPCTMNKIEPDHRAIKARYYPMLGFGTLDSASRFCRAFEEVKQSLRYRIFQCHMVSASDRKAFISDAFQTLKAIFVSIG